MKDKLNSIINNSPLLSIIIATKNRQKYARSAVASILKYSDPRLELIIQDNSDDRTLEDSLAEYFWDRRLKYQYTPPPLSAIENFNRAIQLSTGEYVCMIGDDDGVNPEIVIATDWAKANGIDALVGSLTANYRWSGTGAPDTLFTRMSDSTLTMTHFSGKVRQINIEKSLRRFGSAGFTYYLEFDLPKLYHGVVKRELMEKLHRCNGAYIKALSPDIYLSIALASLVKKLVVVDYPLTLPGVCPESGSIVEGQIKRHSRRLEDAPHFRNNLGYVWSEEVPPIYCVETLWTDSAFHALRDIHREDLLKGFNPYRMYANIINANPETRAVCIAHMKKNLGKGFLRHGLSLVLAFVTGPLERFIRRRALSRMLIVLRLRRLKEIKGLPDIDAATEVLSRYLNELSGKLTPLPFLTSIDANKIRTNSPHQSQ